MVWRDGRYLVDRVVEPVTLRKRGERGDEYSTGVGGFIAMNPRIRRIVWFYCASGIGYERAIEDIAKAAGCSARTATKILKDMRPDADGQLYLLLLGVSEHGLYSVKSELHRMVAAHLLNGNARSPSLRDFARWIVEHWRFSLLD